MNLPEFIRKVLLTCGIIAPLIYLISDLVAGKMVKNYSFSVDSMSDLSALGSPVRQFMIASNIIGCIVMAAFAIGLWWTTSPAVLPRIVAALLAGNAIFSCIATIFFPNRLGIRPDFTTPGVLLMFFSVLCLVLAMIMGAIAFGGWLRILSIAIPVGYILLATFRFITAAHSSAGSTVMIGVQERTMVYSFLAWLIALAIFLLQQSSKTMNQ